MYTFVAEPIVQGSDSILIDAPAERVWPLIADSMQLEAWGPPVGKVEASLLEGQEVEGGRRHAHFFHRPRNLMGRINEPAHPLRSAQEPPHGPAVHQAVRRDRPGHQELRGRAR